MHCFLAFGSGSDVLSSLEVTKPGWEVTKALIFHWGSLNASFKHRLGRFFDITGILLNPPRMESNLTLTKIVLRTFSKIVFSCFLFKSVLVLSRVNALSFECLVALSGYY